jgi:hypothetical protein
VDVLLTFRWLISIFDPNFDFEFFFIMDAHRLVRDELLYEMRVRGLSDLSHETVSTLRRKLSELLRTEAFGVLVTHESFEPDLVVETQTCVEKVTQLSEFLSGRTAIVKGSNDERIVETRMKHLYRLIMSTSCGVKFGIVFREQRNRSARTLRV